FSCPTKNLSGPVPCDGREHHRHIWRRLVIEAKRDEFLLEIVHVVPRRHEGGACPATGLLLVPRPAGMWLRCFASCWYRCMASAVTKIHGVARMARAKAE